MAAQPIPEVGNLSSRSARSVKCSEKPGFLRRTAGNPELISLGRSSRDLPGPPLLEPKEAPMGKPANDEFDAKVFLGKVGFGKTILEFHKNQHVFEQGDVADTVFYIQRGKVKLLSCLSKARKRSSQSWSPSVSSAKAA